MSSLPPAPTQAPAPAPPPTYAQDSAANGIVSEPEAAVGPQIQIVPAEGTLRFQNGALGADGETAAFEGEVQMKGVEGGQWNEVTILLRTLETAGERQVELARSETTLFRAADVDAPWPSSLPFAIPLMADAPQCIHAARSSLTHTLTATLSPHPSSTGLSPISRSVLVHARRFTNHTTVPTVDPRTRTLRHPTLVEVQVPRNVYKAGELIPVYITIPPPPRELIVEHGVRLRNVRIELVRVIRVKGDPTNDELVSSDSESEDDDHPSAMVNLKEKSAAHSSSTSSAALHSSFTGPSEKTVLSRSGAACRFHASRPLKLRFVLRPPKNADGPFDQPIASQHEYGVSDAGVECASISQISILQSVHFRVSVHVGFVEAATRTERTKTIAIPITLLPPSAPLPEVEPSVDAAYRKKHDRPPTRTVRGDDTEIFAPHEGEAGPSTGAPPPFEEREAPPPFFAMAESSSARLPTFLESEADFVMSDAHPLPPSHEFFPGEGTLFGFLPTDTFDGHSEEMQPIASPPPTMEEARRDPDVSDLADLSQPALAVEALNLVLESHTDGALAMEPPPPPPPAVDDPSDPPPSIDSDFRTHSEMDTAAPGNHPSPGPHPHAQFSHPGDVQLQTPAPPTAELAGVNQPHATGHAPPPYAVPDDEHHHEAHVTGPPPYVD